jgi:hypothetical protein
MAAYGAVAQRCGVSVQWHDDDDDKAAAGDRSFDRSTSDEAEVTELMREAQRFILEVSDRPSKVSRSRVQVDIARPDCANLTLVDLPGIVRATGRDEHPSLITDINAIMEENLRNDRCIVLAVVPANTDFHNMQILKDARVHDPKTLRTLPVITKADSVDPGTEGSVADLLLGRKTEPFKLGLHMVKLRNQRDIDKAVTLEDAREEEAAFFARGSAKGWLERVGSDSSLLGVPQLVKKLEQRYMSMVAETVPAVMKEVAAKRAALEAEVRGLGPLDAPGRRRAFRDAADYFLRLIDPTKRGDEGLIPKARLRADGTGPTYWAVMQQEYSSLATQLLTTNFSSEIVVGSKVIYTHFDGTEHKMTVNSFGTGDIIDQIYINGEHCVPNAVNVFAAQRAHVRLDVPERLLNAICDNKHTASGLNIYPTPETINRFVSAAVRQEWQPILERSASAVSKLVEALCRHAMEKSFGSLLTTRPRLRERLFHLVDTTLKECGVDAAVTALCTEESVPHTQNHYLTETLRKCRNDALKNRLTRAVEGVKDGPAAAAIVKRIMEETERTSIDVAAAQELHFVLQAYSKVAAKRVADNAEARINDAVVVRTSAALRDGVNDLSEESVLELMALPAREEKRSEQLKSDLRRLQRAETEASKLLHSM